MESVAAGDLVFSGNSSAAVWENTTRILMIFCLEHNDNALFEIKTF